jgi:hypothetical protein
MNPSVTTKQWAVQSFVTIPEVQILTDREAEAPELVFRCASDCELGTGHTDTTLASCHTAHQNLSTRVAWLGTWSRVDSLGQGALRPPH